MIAYLLRQLTKSIILWFVLDLWPFKILAPTWTQKYFFQKCKQQYWDILNEMKTPWVLVGAARLLITLTPTPPFSFLDYLLGKGGVKKWGFPLGFEPGTPHTTMHCLPMARHPGVTARAAISFPYETRFYDVIGLSAFSSLPLVGFCWTVDG